MRMPAASPPTMIESVPLIAPMSPPLTGASSIVAPTCLRAFGKTTRRTWSDAAHVDDDGARLHGAEDTVGALENQLHVRRIGDHRDDARRLTGHVRR